MSQPLPNLSEETLKLVQDALQKTGTTTGISLSTGLNFYYLEPAVKTLVPVYHPILNRIPRYVPMIGSQPVGGNGVNYKAITAVDPSGYPGLPEKSRAPFIQISEEDFFVPYRFFGKDGYVTFAGEQAGLGLDDNIRLTQWSLLAALLNDVEREILYGNSGPNGTNGGNGLALGTTPTPTLADAGAVAGSTLESGHFFKVACVALAGWGTQIGVSSTGLTPSFSKTGADGSTWTVPGGSAAISALSSEVNLTTSGHGLTATVTPVTGAVAYAWYLSDVASTGTETTATTYFVKTTHAPTITFTAPPSSSNQAANATGLSSDNSYSAYDTDGILTWIAGSQSGTSPAYLKDLGGHGFTSNGDGSVAEIEAALQSQFTNYKITYDEIWCAPDTIGPLSTAVLSGASSNATRINFFTDDAGRMTGGTLITEYRSRYAPQGGAKVMPVMMHPWLPSGTVIFATIKNPYPEVANAIPSTLRIPTMLDFFSIKWPYRYLAHELGVYLFGGLQVYIPFALGMLTGATA